VERPTRQSDRTSDAFIRQVAHDLRASLNVVVSWAELVKAGQLPPEDVSRAGETILRHARHLSERLGIALDLWRLDSGLLAPSMRVVSIGAVVRTAVEESRRLFESRRVSCRLEVRGDGSASVDAPRLAQALVVLLGDAAANTPPDQSVEVTVAGGAQVVIGIVGGGLMPDQAAFDRNVADTTIGPRRPYDFGLALAKELVELNGGVVDIEPADGGRVAMIVRLPNADPQASTDAGARD
jgi:signal transduction histidine kinase